MTEAYRRPDPDALLGDLEREEARQRRGRLKIFFGMCAGVGKTYCMLEAAQRLQREGVDVVAGYVVTHGRAETEALLEGIPLLPRRAVDYRGLSIEEFDLDGALARRAAVTLVDELAHTNVEGSRHAKRYQDVLELLDNGQSVYTTLNVQHLESQADVVEQITGVRVRETVPDSILDRADEIELVDIPPEELLKRLAEGKVYLGEKAERAAENFFKREHLSALREMALHHVARLVDYELRDYLRGKNISGPWKTQERLLVAVSPSPYSEYLIRWTRRMAFNLKAPWIALYIEKQKDLSPRAREILARNQNLARELGAEVLSTVDEDVVAGLIRTAQRQNITQIIVGKPLQRYLTDFINGGNLVERLIRASGDIEIHVVNQPDVHRTRSVAWGMDLSRRAPLRDYLLALGSILSMTLVCWFLVGIVGYWTIALLYFLAVTVLAVAVGRGPVLLAAGLSALLWNFLFIPPLFTFRIARVEDAMMFGMYFFIALFVGGLTSRLTTKEQALRGREDRITALYDLSKTLGNAHTVEDVATGVVSYLEDYCSAAVALFLADADGRLSAEAFPAGKLVVLPKERGVVEWCFHNRKPAGRFTQTLPQADAHYMPLVTPGRVVGVLGIRLTGVTALSLEMETFLTNVAYQAGIHIERENLHRLGRQADLVAESERLSNVLINSISHELRTPLTTIAGAASGLMDETIAASEETRRALAAEIQTASERLNRLVANLLDMSRLETGMLKLNRQRYDVGDLVAVVLRRLEGELTDRPVRVRVADDLPLVSMDFTLMEQALFNVVYNAVAHTPAGAGIAIEAHARGGHAVIAVRDEGPGLDPGDIASVFEKFQRGAGAKTGGTGLGLSISKGVVEAHNGTIAAANDPAGGAVFTVTLPIDPQDETIGERQ